ncbi:hypothetical protein [Halorubrum salinum]|uniref:hypothetical protein n=1 Tax=Halorubrum salinum TaxID=767517 RepID=UPI00211292ED|nr:hypothetical protein [Halorubrum salinum]
MSEDGTGLVSFRVDDPELAGAIEDAAESEGSKSDAIRNGLRAAFLGDGGSETGDESEISVKAREGHRLLVEWTGVGGWMELETAESMLANKMNINTDAIRRLVVKPLKGGDMVRLHQGVKHVWLIVGSAEGGDASFVDETPASTSSTESEAATDGGEARERLEELANAEVGE